MFAGAKVISSKSTSYHPTTPCLDYTDATMPHAPRFSFVSSVHIYKRPNAIIPTAPIASGTPVAAAIPELLELPAVAELAADPVVAAVAKVLLAPLSTDEYDASAADCLEARELASERKELATDPVAVAASEERDAMADDAAAFADE